MHCQCVMWFHHPWSLDVPGALLDHLPQHVVRESVGQAMLEADLCLEAAPGSPSTTTERQEDPL